MSGAPTIFDSDLLALRQERARRMAVPGADFLLRQAVDELADRLMTVNRRFDRAVDIGTPTSALAEALQASGQVGTIERTSWAHVGGAEVLPLEPARFDLAVSALALQWVNDLPGMLTQIRRALAGDGLLLAIFAGGETLMELRNALAGAEAELRGGAGPRVAPFADLRDVGSLLQRAGFALPVVDTDRITVRYDTMFHLVRDLRAMGAGNVLADRDPRPLTRAIAGRAAALYAERFADADGRIRATFDFVSVSAWAPHESQPKPLRPGSATARLEDAVNAAKRAALPSMNDDKAD
ncbi:Methyltransferase domain-containing protein [Kaistia soli DSM 19436]|uniref:Methyltransferase domain-containing protein n=1 Tax=Kaistia soli DSM 19436 TaxID=1122133 RepID=A0A1M5N1K7_9HYPH|nr:methyltransferase domain-containing protein [Kaistia soli]SHG83444.1 Methyltransferase domain-containing protein [Kaistia soli DSM 19436]